MLDDSQILSAIKDLLEQRQALKKACKHIAKHAKYETRCPALLDDTCETVGLPCFDCCNKPQAEDCKNKNQLNFVACCWKIYFKTLSKRS